MEDKLIFDPENYKAETMELDGNRLVYRAYEDLSYAAKPVAPQYQKMNIFVPEAYFEGGSIHGYTRDTAPVFLPNTVGGYMPGKPARPERDFTGKPNAVFMALLHGYVVAAPGARGRGLRDKDGLLTGCAPACIVDLKAAVRYLKYHAGRIPGNMSRIISNGTSAGGALSSLLGVTGNHPDYESCLAEIGAAPAGDDIFAASCYCPITNLDHADMAYEWEFGGLDEYHRMNFERDEATGEVKMTPDTGLMTPEQIALSRELKEMFPAYLNSLQLKEEDGCPLMLNKDGEGTFQEYIKRQVIASIEKALESGGDLSEYGWINSRERKVRDIDFQEYIAYRTRMKTTPAFDDITLKTPENELFGDAHTASRHFTQFSLSHSSAAGKMAEEDQIKRMNPMNYIGDEKCSMASYFRIRHGASDRDTSLAVSAMLTAALRAHGAEVDYHLPWGLAHAGDYDLPELFHWIDDICQPIHYPSQKGF